MPVAGQGSGGSARGRPGANQPRPPHRFQGRTGLLPAVILQPDGLGTLLSGPRLHPGADGGEDREGEARSAPKSPQAQALPPPVPAHPPLSAIRSRCCTITRKALGQDPGCQGPP